MITFRNTRAAAVFAVTALLVSGLVAAPALARPLEREHFSFTGEFDSEDCPGFHIFVDAHFSTLLNTRGPDGTPHWSGNFHGVNVWTNTATGKTVTGRFEFTDRELQVVDNGDDTITITWQATGSERIFGPDGKLLSIRSGLLRGQIVVDLATDQVLAEDILLGPTGRNDNPDVEDATSCEQLQLHTS